MSDPQVRRWTGAFGILSGVLILVVLALYVVVGTSPRAEDVAAVADYVAKHNGVLLTIALADTLGAACFLVFLAGVRHLIRQAKPDYEWASMLVFGAGLVYATLGLVGLTLITGAALDTVNNKADPTVVSALAEGSTPTFGAIGLVVGALFLTSAGYAILGTGALPRWTGWVAYVAAILNLVAAPSIYSGSGPTAFYTADGYVVFLGLLSYVVWLFIAGTSMVVKREAVTPMPVDRR